MKKFVLLCYFISLVSYSQEINSYQYVIVPKKFEAFKSEDKYGLNTSVKLLLEKYGFKVFFNDDYSSEIPMNRCEILTADLINESGLLVTKVKVALKDCKGAVVYQTELGTSREKQYYIAFNQALRAAAKSFDTLGYKYNGKTVVVEPTVAQPVVKVIANNNEATPNTNSTVFYFAQPTANGYQVVDNEPKVIMRLFNTSQKNVFMADKNGVNGTVLLKDGQWFFEHYVNGNLVSEPVNLKF